MVLARDFRRRPPLLVCIGIAGSFSIHGTAPGVAGQRFDVIGLTVLSCVFLGLLVAFNEAGRGGWLSPRFWIGLLVVLALIAVMVWHARHGARRLFDYSILDNRMVRLRLFSYFGMQFINIGISIVFPLYVQDVLGDSAMTAGLMLLPGSLIGSIAAPFAGQAYDRSGLRRPITVSITLMVLALGLLTGFAESLTVVLTGIFYTLLRIGFNIGFGITMSDASKYVAPRQKSDQNSLFSMMQQFAGSLGTAVMSAVIAAQTLHMPVSSATISGSRIDFIILLVLALAIGACVAISFHARRKRKQADATTAGQTALLVGSCLHAPDWYNGIPLAPPSAVSVVPAQSYLVYLCASSPDIASSIVDIPRPILAISTFMNTDRADALREVLQKGEMLAGSTADKRSIVLPTTAAPSLTYTCTISLMH